LCSGWGGISGSDGAYTLEELDGRGAMAGIQDGQIQVTCLGAQYTVTGPMVDEDGNEWPVGTLLTVDSELNFVEVSGFDATDGSSSDTDAFANCPELADWLRQSALASEAAFSGGESVQEAATFFYDFADNAPAEIRDDMLTWADAYQQFADNLDAIGVDFSDPEQMASMTTDQIAALEAAVSGFALPEVESAIDRIDTFIEDSCS
ncbi:MAG: hypothetical protein KJN63_02955, partial [Acidimicrobiia bacterium]|nr:hypothetical protein [Acidimicrobiia bacterium]